MNVVLLSAAGDQAAAMWLAGLLEKAGHNVAICFPDQDSAAALPARTRELVQSADYFIYLVSRHTRSARWLIRLTPYQLAPLCAAGVRILLLVFNEGSPPPGLACVPYLYFLDEQIFPALAERWAADLGRVHALLPQDVALLRYSIRDLEAFLETAQSLAFAYTGLEVAWEEMTNDEATKESNELAALILFRRYAAEIRLEENLPSCVRLEKLIRERPDGGGLLEEILQEYQALEQDWRATERSLMEGLPADIRPPRIRAAAFINLIYLVLTFQLLPYCEQYLHMHGLKQQEDRNLPHDKPPDPAQARLAFLISQLLSKES